MVYFAIINIITYWLFYHDKSSARKGGWRVPEKSLFLVSLLGGSLAALLAIKTLRHKTRKIGFQLTIWAIILLQLVLITLFLSRPEFFHTVA